MRPTQEAVLVLILGREGGAAGYLSPSAMAKSDAVEEKTKGKRDRKAVLKKGRGRRTKFRKT